MSDSLDVLGVLGKDSFDWIGFARTYDEAISVIRNFGKPGTFLVHSQTTGRRTFYKVEADTNVVQLAGQPRD